MTINKEKSSFQFTDPRTDECVFIVNQAYSLTTCEELPVKLTTNVRHLDTEKNVSSVSLDLEVGEQNNQAYPFYLKFVESAMFKWEDGSFDNKTIKELLDVNAPALLLSYMRPLVFTITSQSIHGGFHIPFLDLRNGIKENEAEENL